jgi:hypothetical protein
MNVFKYLCVSAFLLLASCYNGLDYVVHGSATEVETEVIILTTEPDPDIWIESFTQVASYEKIDILWVIDGSCSMQQHKTRLLSGIEHMMNNLPTDINWRLKMITAGEYKWITQPTTFPLTRGDTITDAMNMYNDLPNDGGEAGFAATKNYILDDAYASTWLRSDAAMLVVFVSDEEEQSDITVSEFTLWYENYRKTAYISFIGNVDPSVTLCPVVSSADVGKKYIDAANYFSGTVVDICEADWSSGVDDATQKIEPIEEWELAHVPYEHTIVVFEDGSKMDPAEWVYDPAINIIEFVNTPPEGALIEIGYAIKFYKLNP